MVPDKRPQREMDLMFLSGLGQMGPGLEGALMYPDRARYVAARWDAKPASKELKKLRLRKLELGGPPPSWIGDLVELRSLQCIPDAKLPASLFTLPHLRFLHVDGSKLANLDGIEKLPALEYVTFSNTPLSDDPAVDKVVAKLKGARRTSYGLDLRAAKPAAPKDKKKVLAAFLDGSIADESDLRKADFSNQTFEDLFITHDLRGAKLANTTWLRCDFESSCTLSGADLTGATFYDCDFSARYDDIGNLRGIKAAGSTWVGCGGSLQLDGADLQGAKLLDMEPDVAIDMNKAKGAGLALEISFCSEREHRIEATGADLRGARVHIDIDAGRRAELKKKKTARLAWRQTHLKGAKTDKTTQIVYAALDAASAANPTRAAEQTVDPKGKAAEILGVFHASNASLWCVIADSAVAANWRGAVDENDKKDDFQRALNGKDGRIAIGDAEGIKFEIGDNGFTNVYAVENGFLLLDCSCSLDDKRERDRALALRVAQWPATKPKSLGKLPCPTGILAVMLPYRDGKFTAKQLAKAKGGKVVEEANDYDRLLVPMKNGPGIYEVAMYPFKPPGAGRGEYEDDVGTYGFANVITYVDKLPKRA